MENKNSQQQKDQIIALMEENSNPQSKRPDNDQQPHETDHFNYLLNNFSPMNLLGNNSLSSLQVSNKYIQFFSYLSVLTSWSITPRAFYIKSSNLAANIITQSTLNAGFPDGSNNGLKQTNVQQLASITIGRNLEGRKFIHETRRNIIVIQEFPDPSLLNQQQLLLHNVLFNQTLLSSLANPAMPFFNQFGFYYSDKQQPQNDLNYGINMNNNFQFMGDSKEFSDSKIKRKHIKKQHNPQYNTGHWTSQEHQMYMSFLLQHKEIMESPELKKTNKIFKLMSDIIKTRSPSQCRSHHQKFNPFSKYVQNQIQNVIRRKMKGDGSQQQDQNQQSQEIQNNNSQIAMIQQLVGQQQLPHDLQEQLLAQLKQDSNEKNHGQNQKGIGEEIQPPANNKDIQKVDVNQNSQENQENNSQKDQNIHDVLKRPKIRVLYSPQDQIELKNTDKQDLIKNDQEVYSPEKQEEKVQEKDEIDSYEEINNLSKNNQNHLKQNEGIDQNSGKLETITKGDLKE